MPAEKAARQILRACQYGEAERIIANPTNLAIKLQSLFPGLTQTALTVADRMLPVMGGIGERGARGYESESGWSPSILTVLTERAAARNNEMRRKPRA
jgi:hypothetical protein